MSKKWPFVNRTVRYLDADYILKLFILGIGRENGTQVIESYTQTKSVYVEMNDVDCGQLYQE